MPREETPTSVNGKSSVGVLADIHLHNYKQFSHILEDGTSSRLQHGIDCLRWFADRCAEQTDTIVIVGDVFHSRSSVPHQVLDKVCSAFTSIEERFKDIYVVMGNHDISVSGDRSNALKAIASRNVHVIDTPDTYTIRGEAVGVIPYTEDVGLVESAFAKFADEDVACVFAHLGMLGGAVGPSDFEVPGTIPFASLSLDSFKRVVLGHFHKHQELSDNVFYVGSPLQLTWGESGEDKGFVFLDLKTGEYEFEENDISPRFIKISADEDTPEFNTDDFIRVEASDDVDSIRADLEEVGVRDFKIDPVKREVAESPRLQIAGLKEHEMLERYVKEFPPSVPLSGKERVKFMEIGADALRRASE